MRAALVLLLVVVLASAPAAAHQDFIGDVRPHVTPTTDGFHIFFTDNTANACFRLLTDRHGTVIGKKTRVRKCPEFASGLFKLGELFPARATELKATVDVLPIDSGHRFIAAGGDDDSLHFWLLSKDDQKPARRVTIGPSAYIYWPVASNLLLHQGSVLIAWVTPEGDLRLASWNPDAPPEAMRTDTLATGLSKNNTVTIALNGDDLVVAWHDFDPAKRRATIRTAHRRLPLAK